MSIKAGLKLVSGVGYNDGKYKTYDVSSGKHTKEYHLWKGMLTRCYIKTKFYEDSSVSENFKNYSYFYEWCNDQKGFNQDGFELDKDLLFKGNTIYSENSCVFLPKEINKVLTNRKRHRGEYPVGVSYHKVAGKFSATCSLDGQIHHLGCTQLLRKLLVYTRKLKKIMLRN